MKELIYAKELARGKVSFSTKLFGVYFFTLRCALFFIKVFFISFVVFKFTSPLFIA
ncbi:MAG TPA: hypothetical protein VLL98_00310 [Rickettsiales bacterium]|nr:hypothetical protein [Rickettsiales bacterium]